MKRLVLLALFAGLLASAPARAANPVVVIETSMGTIKVELNEEKAPITVKNFLGYVNDKHYDGTIFHRVIPDFMIQGGDPTGTGTGSPGYSFQDETKGSPHRFDKPGKLAMANSGPNTNGCQFFITVAPTPWLPGNHTIFGEVVEGQNIADKISKVARGGQDKPHKPVVIESVTIERLA